MAASMDVHRVNVLASTSAVKSQLLTSNESAKLREADEAICKFKQQQDNVC
jgi:hypothetical protein